MFGDYYAFLVSMIGLSAIKEFRYYEAKIEESETSWESNRLAVVAQ